MSTVRWSAIRDKHIEAIGREDVERGTSRLISQGPQCSGEYHAGCPASGALTGPSAGLTRRGRPSRPWSAAHRGRPVSQNRCSPVWERRRLSRSTS